MGDLVLTKDQDNPQDGPQLRPVTAVEQHVVDHVRVLTVRDADGNVETIRTTDEHPFFVLGQGWTDAGNLLPGQTLVEGDGSNDATVLASTREEHPQGLAVYNFAVEGDHTYFVEDGQGGQTAVWVHNRCWSDLVRDKYDAAPAWMAKLRPHGHHIVFKGNYFFRPKMRNVLQESREILARAGIKDYVHDIRNLTWAPNRGHNLANATLVRDRLKQAELLGGSDEVLREIATIGEQIRLGIIKM